MRHDMTYELRLPRLPNCVRLVRHPAHVKQLQQLIEIVIRGPAMGTGPGEADDMASVALCSCWCCSSVPQIRWQNAVLEVGDIPFCSALSPIKQ